jgi:glycosyltransferase involved in cell wall biosynthesis
VKVLFAIQPNLPNGLIRNISFAIENNSVHIDTSLDHFWHSNNHYDLIHIHWPEALLKWEAPTEVQISRLKDRLSYWKEKGSTIIITRHNYLPHIEYPLNSILYQKTYESADAVIHFGPFSEQEFIQRYPSLRYIKHYIIPHPIYPDIPNRINSFEARRTHNFSSDHKIFLVFGKIRKKKEQDFIQQGFNQLKLNNKQLLFSTGMVPYGGRVSGRKAPLKYLLRNLHKNVFDFKNRLKGIKISNQFVPEEEIQTYMNAADVVVIQRENQLNSGNLPLAFTFGKVVVGPESGNIGEILKNSGNPTFIPGNIENLTDAMKEGFMLSREGQGRKNQELAQKEWSIEVVAQRHIEVYEQVLARQMSL